MILIEEPQLVKENVQCTVHPQLQCFFFRLCSCFVFFRALSFASVLLLPGAPLFSVQHLEYPLCIWGRDQISGAYQQG